MSTVLERTVSNPVLVQVARFIRNPIHNCVRDRMEPDLFYIGRLVQLAAFPRHDE